DGEAACVFKGERVVEKGPGRTCRLALDAESAQLLDALRPEPDMALHGNARAHDRPHSVREGLAAFHLDRVHAPFFQETAGIAHGLLGAGLVAHEWQVTDQE